MSINITILESSLQTKIDGLTGTSDSKEFLLLSKALEAVRNGLVVTVPTVDDLPLAVDNTGRVIVVGTTVYVSTGVGGWITLIGAAGNDGLDGQMGLMQE